MPLEIIFKSKTKTLGPQANLDAKDMQKVTQEIMLFVLDVQNREHPVVKTSIILIGPTTQEYLSPQRCKFLTRFGLETFQILYYDKQWSLSRCLSNLRKLCLRRLDAPGTWDIAESEGQGMYLAPQGEQHEHSTIDLSDTTPIRTPGIKEGE